MNGVLFSIFFKTQKQQTHRFLDDNQIKWLEISKFILKTQPPNYAISTIGYISKIYALKKSILFSRLKFLILLMNLIILCLFSDRNSLHYFTDYQYIYLIITSFYLFEFAINILIYRFSHYLGKSLWHNFLALITFMYFSNNILMFFPDVEIIQKNSHSYRFFRFLLILSTFRLIKRFKALKKLFSFLYFSFPMIFNLIYLLFLIFFIYAIIGCRWFSAFTSGEVIDDYLNFKNFFYALMTMFRTGTANNWTSLMFDIVSNEGDDASSWIKLRDYLFFVSFMVMTFFFMINLFTLTLTKQFEEFYLNINSPLQLYKDNLKKFRKVWSKFCLKSNLLCIKNDQLSNFFKNLGLPLGCNKHDSELEVGKTIMKLQLKEYILYILYIKHNEYSIILGKDMFILMNYYM